MLARECAEPLKKHYCQGPLYRVTDNGVSKVLCLGIIKRYIRSGHEIDIGDKVPRKFKKEESSIYIMDPPWKRKLIFKDKKTNS